MPLPALPRRCAIVLWTATAALGCRTNGIATEEAALDDGRQWLDSRNLPPPAAPPLLRAAAASARNQTPVSESLLRTIVESQPASDSARRAYELLSRIYLRSGQYSRLLANLDDWARGFPTDPALPGEKESLEQFRGLPDQTGGPVRPSTLRHSGSGDFAAPILIEGQPAAYLLDTGAWMSVMTSSEAERLGLTIRAGAGRLSESSGKGVSIRMAVAGTVVVGSAVFHDVSFAIMPDVEPWRSMPAGRGGIIGIPVLLHLGCIRWTSDGDWNIGCPEEAASGADAAGLVFYRNRLLAAATVWGRQVFMTLDTGAEGTDLNASFASQFATQLRGIATRDTTRVSGMGGTALIESLTVPEVPVRIGGVVALLRPAHITLQENPALGGQCCVGNLGLDLLLQSGALTIDFSRMTLRLR